MPPASDVNARPSAGDLLRAMRPGQWIKNLVVLAAPLFALRFDLRSLLLAATAFVSFTLVAGASYMFNDVRDRAADRQHRMKRRRPIAAGAITVRTALLSGLILALVALVLSLAVAPYLAVTVALFALLQILYSLLLKSEPVLDLMLIATGYDLRALGGAAAVGVPVSGWFLLCLWLLALFLAIEKRKAELLRLEGQTPARAVLGIYTLDWLNRLEIVVTASALMTYSLWAIGRTVLMLVTVPLVAYGLFKYQLLAEQHREEASERLIFASWHIPITVAIWIVASLGILALAQEGRLPIRWLSL
jgi:4-hydroxybenzoate polyprenyltransferase